MVKLASLSVSYRFVQIVWCVGRIEYEVLLIVCGVDTQHLALPESIERIGIFLPLSKHHDQEQ